nr:TetR/AcrR family transcriptional regulator [Pseudoruegeria sp. HB172150]
MQAAKEVFAESGVDAPVREIAKRAGVGIGTVYRNFPKRSDLIAGVFRREVDVFAEAGQALAGSDAPFEALARWSGLYVDFLATKRGLGAALYSGDPAYEALPGYFRARLEPVVRDLLENAAAAGEVRKDVDPYELLRAIGSLSATAETGGAETARRMVGLLLDGLRYGVERG